MSRRSSVALAIALVSAAAAAQPPQEVQDEYAVYELLSPETASFKAIYEVAVTTPGATTFFDRIGSGLRFVESGDDSVVDLMTGAALKVEQRADGLQIQLARPIPRDGGQARLRIVKTYRDARSYRRDGDTIVFERAIGIRRASFVLPPGFRVTDCNVPSQVLSEADGRIRVSFMHQAPGP